MVGGTTAAHVGDRARGVEAVRGRDLFILAKPEVSSLVLAATFIGFYLGSPSPLDLSRLAGVLLGTGLVAGGTGALNMYLEREADGRMRRTANRPLPAGRMRPRVALGYGLFLAAVGGVVLYFLANPLSCALAIGTLLSYLLLYTPLKSRTHLCTLVGAFPGAMPPLIGWAAARGSLGVEAFTLYLILFLWQFPHFLAIAWIYRQDYARAGMVMLPPADARGDTTHRRIIMATLALVPASLLPAFLSVAGAVYVAGALVLGAGFLVAGIWASAERTSGRARVLLHASVAYLPLLYALLVLDARSG